MTAITERPVLTLHHGDAEVYAEHPMEVARRALMEAAALEPCGSFLDGLLRRIASDLPHRERIINTGR